MTSPAPTSDDSDEATVTFPLHGCRCGERSLNLLIAAVRDGTANRPVRLVAHWQGVRIRRNNLAAVRAAIGQSVNPADPRRLDRLQIETVQGDCLVRIDLKDTAVVTVESGDDAWAIGKAEQIRKILTHAGGSTRPRRVRPWRWALAGALGVGLLTLVGAVLLGPTGVVAGAALTGAFLAAGGFGGYLVARQLADRSRPVIWIDGEIPRRGWHAWSTADRISFGGLVVALGLGLARIFGG